MKVPFSDLSALHKEIKKEIDVALNKVIKKGDFILGQDEKLFELEFAAFCGSRFGVGVSSGTAALFLALRSLGIKEGDEVIVPAFTYIASALAVSYTGAKPVFVDIREDTYNIDPAKIRKLITKNTKAIMPVHIFGQPANMPAVLKIAREYNLKVVEDAAQGHGAFIKVEKAKQLTGSIGDIGCFSLYPTKNLGALGDGGIITTNDEQIYNRLLMLRDYGRVSRYEHSIIGYNSRLDTLQAAVLSIKLKRLKGWNNMRQKNAEIYNKLLKGVNGVVTPFAALDLSHVYHVYAIRVKERDKIYQQLLKNGISAIIHYPIPVHLQLAYKGLGYKKGDLPVAEIVSQEIISLPMYPHMKESQIKFVVDTIKKIIVSLRTK